MQVPTLPLPPRSGAELQSPKVLDLNLAFQVAFKIYFVKVKGRTYVI